VYTKFYNLLERPFNLTPDSHFLYLSSQHREALGHLIYGIRERKGFILVSGEVGTGKTTLCRALITEIEKEAEVGFILNSFLSAEELLKTINEDLSCHRGAVSRKELVDELNRFLLAQHEAGRNVVVLIDECQNLALPVLEQLRMLSNLETEKEKLIQIVLVGQPELREMLESPALRQLAQRVTVTYHLQPLTCPETARYIQHRLAVAAGGEETNPVQFTGPAVKRIFRYSEGLPRKINIVCDRALLIGYVRGSKKITDSIVRRALEEIQSHPGTRHTPGRRGGAARVWRAAAAAAFVAAAAVAVRYAARPAPAPAPHAGAEHPEIAGGYKASAEGGSASGGQIPDPPPKADPAPTDKSQQKDAASGQITDPARHEGKYPAGWRGGLSRRLAGQIQNDAANGSAPQETLAPPGEGPRVVAAPAVKAPVENTPSPTAPLETPPPRATPVPGKPAVPVVATTREAESVALLAAFWGKNDLKPEMLGDSRNIHALAARCGMKSVSCWGDVDFIRRMNLPCILSLRGGSGEEPVRAVLALVRGGRAVLLWPGGGEKSFAAPELQAALCGRAIYFYPTGIVLPNALAPGMRGPEVRALQQSLKRAGALRGGEEDLYGPETAAAVGRFQERHGLPVDGVAGTSEWMLLKSLDAREGVPRLIPGAPQG
jgi:general secretion pathway protein A